MPAEAKSFKEFRVIRRFGPAIGLLSVLVPGLAHAQTNLDQGKSASQIFASDCAECHKAARGLAKGKNSAALTDFLREHYTTSREQAAGLAAYVLGGRGSEPIGVPPGQAKKPPPDRASASTEEPKPAKRQKPPRPDEGASANARPQQPSEPDVKPREEANPPVLPSGLNPIIRPEEGQRPASATRTRHKEPKAPPSAPASVAHVPPAAPTMSVPTVAPSQIPSPQSSTSSSPDGTPPADAASGENAPVPRDNVPD
jgi:hypothetical protein